MKIQTKRKIWATLMRWGNRFGCHQREDRSLFLKEWQFPICSRCTGILTGQIIAVFLAIATIHIPFWLDAIFLGIMFLDWFLQYKNIKESTNIRRFITGNLAGIAQISIVVNLILLFLQR